MHLGLLGTRRATSTAVDGFAGNMEVVREESGPTDTGCARGLSDRGLESGVRWLRTGSRAKTVRYRRGINVVKHPLTLLTARVGAIP